MVKVTSYALETKGFKGDAEKTTLTASFVIKTTDIDKLKNEIRAMVECDHTDDTSLTHAEKG